MIIFSESASEDILKIQNNSFTNLEFKIRRIAEFYNGPVSSS